MFKNGFSTKLFCNLNMVLYNIFKNLGDSPMISKTIFTGACLMFAASFSHAGSLDGKTFNVEFQTESPEKGIVEFKNDMIVSPIHKEIQDKENEINEATPMQAATMQVAPGAPYRVQSLAEGINFTGRIEGFPPVYWSGWVRGSEIEGAVNVESSEGPYMIPFKGKEK